MTTSIILIGAAVKQHSWSSVRLTLSLCSPALATGPNGALNEGSILEGPTGYVLAELVTQAVPVLLQHMKDPILLVKDTASWTLGRISQFHSQSITSKLPEVVTTLIGTLEDEPRIAAKACWVRISYMFSHLQSGSSSGLGSSSGHPKSCQLVRRGG